MPEAASNSRRPVGEGSTLSRRARFPPRDPDEQADPWPCSISVTVAIPPQQQRFETLE